MTPTPEAMEECRKEFEADFIRRHGFKPPRALNVRNPVTGEWEAAPRLYCNTAEWEYEGFKAAYNRPRKPAVVDLERVEASVAASVYHDDQLQNITRDQAMKIVRYTLAALPDSGMEGQLASALKRLVDLKTHKDAHGKNNWYVNNQKAAWEQAQQALQRFNASKGDAG
jgi:hypothetical protein